MKVKIIGLVAAVALVAALAAIASGATGAYFSDTHNGQISGTVGSIKVAAGINADTGGGLNFSFTNLLPGEPQSGTVNYTNSGTSPEDVYIVFPNADALHALNDLGTYGSVSIVDTAGGLNWVSNNLSDFYPSGTPGNEGVATLYHVPSQMLLQANVAPAGGGAVTFTFAYSSKISNPAFEGGNWNSYPVASETKNGETYTPTGTLYSLNGLPYEIVACQVGQTPGALVHPPLTPSPSWY